MKKIITAVIVLLLMISSCAPVTSSRYREGDNTGQQAALTVSDERRLTEEALGEIRKDYPPVNNRELQSYLSDLGGKIARANNLEGNPYHYEFSVVDSKNVNAFALPAGKIFVTVPLIAMAANEAELAGVVGHEMGHVVARHAAERMYLMEKENKKTWLFGAGGGVLGGLVGYGLGTILCAEGDKACLAKAAVIGAAAGAGGGLLVQKYGFLANSREDEMEADRVGFRLAVNAGYDKDKIGDFHKKLLQVEKNAGGQSNSMMKSLSDVMSTHPPSEQRVAQMEELAAKSPPQKNAVADSARFRKVHEIALGLSAKNRSN
jgi:beta-barrel assembly-enhancing protease